ncbi:glycoside hydrolase family 73 protein [Lactococcus allomyrinae]|uniref:N-acetyl-muramidase n=1 Tax=Lactococcus allomyrinae TaxID=2419773 RepID=A0A387BCP2_9LACT|nr:glycoside hydrolase family 73 protein [Lactococcus allomyrinae]AYG00124.1 N-acetyl-muramidase [Lactococcus allomyrinae]
MKTQTRRKNKYRLAPFFLKLILLILIIFSTIFYKTVTTNNSVSSAKLSTQLQKMIQYNFIREIAPLAQKAYKEDKVLASITLAQACLESDFGQSTLASKYHNLFGVKAYGNVPTVKLDTQEYENGQWITIKGEFRVYPSFEKSVLGHTKLFLEGTTWNPKQYASVLAAKDYTTAAKAVQTSGYATDPSYADKLIQMIQTYHLDNYDQK